MSVIVKHKENNQKYVMIGTGYGTMKEDKNKFFGDHLIHQDDEKLSTMAAVCDYKGQIFWYDTDDLKIIEIDGEKIEDFELE